MKKKKNTDIAKAFERIESKLTVNESFDSSDCSEQKTLRTSGSRSLEWPNTQRNISLPTHWRLPDWSRREWSVPEVSLPFCRLPRVSVREWSIPHCWHFSSPSCWCLPDWISDRRKTELWITLRIVGIAFFLGIIIGVPVRVSKNRSSGSVVDAATGLLEPDRFNNLPRKTFFPTVTPPTAPGIRTAAPTKVPSTGGSTEEPQLPEDQLSASIIPLLINSGFNSSLVDSRGNHWVSDSSFTDTGITFGMEPCVHTHSAVEDDIYCSGRMNVQRYDISIPNNTYAVTLHMLTDEQERMYDVYLEGARVYREIAEPRDDAFFTLNLETLVQDQSLTIEFKSNNGFLGAIVAAIEVHHTTAQPTDLLRNLTYLPGSLTVEQHGLILSEGLTAKIIANGAHRLQYRNGEMSEERFHVRPDAGATYPDERPGNAGGWVYVSNSEAELDKKGHVGGVGALTFDKDGELIDYQMILNGTMMNCGGGKTPWGAWISGEEYREGRIWQVDPMGVRKAHNITMGETHIGLFESFAMDDRNKSTPRFFMTKDHENGALRRFTPDNPDWEDPWSILLGSGSMDYLIIEPSGEGSNEGTYRWELNHSLASELVIAHYPGSEGIDVDGNELLFVSKSYRTMFILNLDDGSYVNKTMRHGLFWGQPDQLVQLVDVGDSDMLYFTEDGGKYAGVHGRNSLGQYYTILESHVYADETTGLAFSPNAMHMYIAYQDNDILFDITREDGLPFRAKSLNVKFHSTARST